MFTSLFSDGRRPYSQGGKRDSSFRRRPGSVTAPGTLLLRDGLQRSRTWQDCVGAELAVRLQIFFSKKGTNNDIDLAEGGIEPAFAQPCPQPSRAL